jgi:hypothetical protein
MPFFHHSSEPRTSSSFSMTTVPRRERLTSPMCMASLFLMMMFLGALTTSTVSATLYVNGAGYSILAPLQIDRLEVQTQLILQGVDIIKMLQEQASLMATLVARVTTAESTVADFNTRFS